MSIDAIGAVLRYSKARGNRRMVMVVIAECANHDGGGAYPSIETVADRSGVDKRTAQRAIRDLVDLGELEVEEQAGPKGCNLYRVTLSGDDSLPPRQPDVGDDSHGEGGWQPDAGGMTPLPPEPSTEPSKEPEPPSPPFSVLAVLDQAADAKRAKRPKPDTIAKIVAEFPGVDPEAAARDVRFYLTEGNGKDRRNVNVASTFRTFMRPKRGQRSEHPADAEVRKWQERAERFAAEDAA